MSKDRFLRMTYDTARTRTPSNINILVAENPEYGIVPDKHEDVLMKGVLDEVWNNSNLDLRAAELEDRKRMPLRFLYAMNLLIHISHLIAEYGIQLESLKEDDEILGTDHRKLAIERFLGQVSRACTSSCFGDNGDTVDLFRDTEGEISYAGVNFYPFGRIDERITLEELDEAIRAARDFSLVAQELRDAMKKDRDNYSYKLFSNFKKILSRLGGTLVPLIRK